MQGGDGVDHPDLKAMLDYWKSRRSGQGLPARRDIDPVDFPKVLPRVALVDVLDEPDGLHFRYRLTGTEIVARAGRDPTGKRFDALYSGDYLAQALETYRTIVDSRAPHYSRRAFPMVDGREHLEYARLILPLAADGRRGDMLLLVTADLKAVSQDPVPQLFDPHNP